MVTDLDGHITQNVVYIPYGEVFVEERNGSWTSPYLFNAKELDEETGLYYYGARYLDPPGARWLSVDPMWEKYMGMSPYNYCAGNPVKLVDPDGRKTFNGMSDYNQYNEYTGERTLIDYIIKGTETDKENTDNIYEHGSSIAIEHNGDYIMPFQVKKHFELDEDILVLHSCNTGYGNDCFAENLSFEYPDRIIVAPSTDICWEVEYNNGVIEVTEKVSNIKDGKLGEWNIFQKGNKIGSFAGNEIPHKDLVKDTVKECNFKKNNMNKCIIIIYLIVFCFSRVGGEEHLPMLVIKGNENMYPFNDDKDCYYESEFFMYSLLMVYRFNSKTASQNLIKELSTKTDSSGFFTKYIISSIKSSANATYTKCKEIEFDNIPLDSIKIIDPDALMYYKMIEYPDYLNSVKEIGDEKDYASLKDSLLEKCSDAGESFVFNYSTSALIFKAIESANNEKAYGYSYFYRFIKLWMTIRSVNMDDRMKLLCLNVLKMSAARGDEYAIREYERLINRPFHKVNASLQGSTIY